MAETTTHQGKILRQTDPFVLDETIETLETLNPQKEFPLPLVADRPGGSTDEDRPFLQTPFNQLDGGYRSPWKNNNNGGADSDALELEQTANEVWDAYRQLYYGHDAVGSVFVRRKGSGEAGKSPSKAKKGGALEALFGIHKECHGPSGQEIARWDSVHTVTIEVPNFDEGTCEYAIRSAVWCRYKPEDVGDAPRADKKAPSPPPAAAAKPTPKPAETAPAPAARPKKTTTGRKKVKSIKLDISRLEVFDKAADNWSNDPRKRDQLKKDAGQPQWKPKPAVAKAAAPPPPVVPKGKPLPPIPAVVTSSAVYTKETTKVCRLQLSKGKKASSKSIPVGSHIQNIGSLLEKIETDIRSKVERVGAPKCVEVLKGMYRPDLSPGLRLPGRSKSEGSASLVSKLGGHATGMGVGKGLIGEIALKAKSKGFGSEEFTAGTTSSSSSKNKAMESLLVSEKKKLQDLQEEPAEKKTPDTWKVGLKKSSRVSPTKAQENQKPPAAQRPNLRKAVSARHVDPKPPSSSAATPEFMNFRSKLSSAKAASVRKLEPTPGTNGSSTTPEFMNFRNKLRPAAAK